MGMELDALLKQAVVDSPTTVDSEYFSPIIDIRGREAECSVDISYDGGNGSVDMKIILQVSNDGVTFANLSGNAEYPTLYEQIINDDDGVHIMDIFGTGTNYLRVKIEVTAGSITLQKINYSGRRRH